MFIDGLQLPYGIKPANPVPVDALSGPYEAVLLQDAINLANATIPSALRYKSMLVRLIVSGESLLYWYKYGIADSNLVNYAPKKLEFVIGDGINDTFTINHNLGTKFVIVQIFDSNTGDSIETDVNRSNPNSVIISFANPPSIDGYSLVIM